MNVKTILFILIFFPLVRLFSQDIESNLAFYPLQKGNYWEYCETHSSFRPDVKEKFYSLTVVGDTILSNQVRYKIIRKDHIPDTLESEFIYERIDSLTGNVYRYSDQFQFVNDEYLIDSLYSQQGETSRASRNDPWTADFAVTLCVNATPDTLFNQDIYVKVFAAIHYIPGFHYWLAQDIGLIQYIYGSETDNEIYHTLAYANIQGKEYGHKRDTKVRGKAQRPEQVELFQNYPNPFNSQTTITFQLPKTDHVVLQIFNVQGQRIHTLVDQEMPAGVYQVTWDSSNDTGSHLSSGVYVYRLTVGEYNETRKLLLIK